MNEATIIVNGRTLTVGQAMTVRVALGSFLQSVIFEGLGDDEHGRAMSAAYAERCREVLTFLAAR